MTIRWRARMPADIERPDKILAGLTARQLAILTSAGGVLWLARQLTRGLVPLPVFAAAALVVGAVVLAVTLGRRDGAPLDVFFRQAITHLARPKRLIGGTAPGRLPRWAPKARQPRLAPLRLPARAIREDGVIDLGGDGCAVLLACGTVNFALASEAEQDALIGGFAAALNSLSRPVQVLVRAERQDLTGHAAVIAARAPALPHPALEAAALGHAAYLQQLQAGRDLLCRQIALVVRAEQPASAAGRVLLDQAHDLAGQLAAAGIEAAVLSGGQAHLVLTSCLHSTGPFTGHDVGGVS